MKEIDSKRIKITTPKSKQLSNLILASSVMVEHQTHLKIWKRTKFHGEGSWQKSRHKEPINQTHFKMNAMQEQTTYSALSMI